MSFSATAACTMPVPKKRIGLTWGPLTAPVQICLYVDPLCPDCIAAWATTDALIKKYGDKICVTAYMLALPFHTWSFTIQRTINAVKEICPEKAKQVFHDLFTNSQSKLNSASLAGNTEAQAVEAIIKYAAGISGLPFEQIKEKYDSDAVFFNARVEFKFACQNGVTGTPNFFINGAKTAIGDKATVNDWATVLDPLLQ